MLLPAGVAQAGTKDAGAFDFHHADPAGAGGGGPFEVAEGGDIDAVALGNLQNGFTWFKRERVAIDDNVLGSVVHQASIIHTRVNLT